MPNPRDLINESDFLRGNVKQYKVIVDDATLVMDDALIAKIKEWVRTARMSSRKDRRGGTVPETPDAWLINRLTGLLATGSHDNRVRRSRTADLHRSRLDATRQMDHPFSMAADCIWRKSPPEYRTFSLPGKAGVAMGVRRWAGAR